MKNAIRVICSDRQEDLKLLSKKKKGSFHNKNIWESATFAF